MCINPSWRHSILKPEQSNQHKNGRMKLWNYPSNLIYQIADFFLIGPVLPATLFLFPILPMSLFFLNTCFLIRAFFLHTHQRRVCAWQLGSYSWVEVWDTLGAYIKCSLAFLPACTHTHPWGVYRPVKQGWIQVPVQFSWPAHSGIDSSFGLCHRSRNWSIIVLVALNIIKTCGGCSCFCWATDDE